MPLRSLGIFPDERRNACLGFPFCTCDRVVQLGPPVSTAFLVLLFLVGWPSHARLVTWTEALLIHWSLAGDKAHVLGHLPFAQTNYFLETCSIKPLTRTFECYSSTGLCVLPLRNSLRLHCGRGSSHCWVP